MTDEQQNDNPIPTPPPLPGQVFVRPGIDDRPDLDKALTPEDKAALARLTIRQNPRQPEASGDRPEVQAAQMSAEGAPMAAAARIDTAVPNLESSFLDLRDPMVDADGYRPSATEMTRMFAAGAVLCAAPLGALNTVILPVLVDRFAGVGRTLPLALLIAFGVVMSVLSNAVVAVLSDHTRTELGRRTPWILGGAVVAALFTLPLGASANTVILTLLWCLVQIGYVMLSAPIAAAFGERIPDKFRSRADAYRGIGLTVGVGQLLGAVVAVLLIRTPSVAIRLCAACFVVAAVVVVLVLPRERSSVELRSRAIEQHEFFSHYQMPKGAPNFVRVLVARLVMTAGVSLTGVFLWYIVLYAVNGGDVDAAVPVMAAVAVASFVRRRTDRHAGAGAGGGPLGGRPYPVGAGLRAVCRRSGGAVRGAVGGRRDRVCVAFRMRLCDLRRHQPASGGCGAAGHPYGGPKSGRAEPGLAGRRHCRRVAGRAGVVRCRHVSGAVPGRHRGGDRGRRGDLVHP